ncbi:MAG: YkvA family protein [Acidobacteriota bacterium]
MEEDKKSILNEIIMYIPNFLKLMYGLVSDPRVKFQEKALLGATIAYVLSPIDLIPDIIPFLGQVDDLLLVSLVVLRFLEQSGQDVVLQYWKGRRSLLDLTVNTLKLSAFFIPPAIYDKIIKKSGYEGEYIDAEYHVNKDSID